MTDDQNNVPKDIPPVTEEQEKRFKEAGAAQKAARLKDGHADDGTYIIIETDLSAGMQTVVSMPHDNNEILRFVHPQLAKNYIAEWGEAGYGYVIFQAGDGVLGKNSAEDLKARRESADKEPAAPTTEEALGPDADPA